MTPITPRGMRLHIGVFGRRNAGKSSLVNALAGQRVAIVSEVPGTTTDPVSKALELHGLGPVVLLDTAGTDDAGALGTLRTARTRAVFDRVDLALIVTPCGQWTEDEQALLEVLERRHVAVVVVASHGDVHAPSAELAERLASRQVPLLVAALPPDAAPGWVVRYGCAPPRREALDRDAVEPLIEAVAHAAARDPERPSRLLADLLATPPGLVVMVMPIDAEAPHGRLILPQVQSLREALDHHAITVVCQATELDAALARLTQPPDLVITDSQAFASVAADVPSTVALTSFSILFARLRGDLVRFAEAAAAVDRLRPGDSVLVAESCSHHAIEDDIGRVKIPRLLQARVGGALRFAHVQGHDFPETPDDFQLVIQCGGCMTNRREILSRMRRCRSAGVPMTNYGVCLAHCLGILPRALGPFPAARDAWTEARGAGDEPHGPE